MLVLFDAVGLGPQLLSRRDVLRFSAGAGLAAVMLPLLAACGGDDDSDRERVVAD
jgi:uncharacterized protein (DUF1501 family)